MISSAYNYYLTQYASSRENNRYTTHKKSELRNIYNSMLRSNRRAPLYKIDKLDEATKYAIDLKEVSADIIDIADSIGDTAEGKGGFKNKQAASSNESIATARYIGTAEQEDGTEAYNIKIKQLAGPQVNQGHFLKDGQKALDTGTYSFDLNIGEYSYEFQFNVTGQDDNRAVNEKLARLFNRSNVGINATVEELDGSTALRLESVSTGVSEKRESSFRIINNNKGNAADPVRTLGIGNTIQKATNAEFTVNGIESSSLTNTFTINSRFEVTLHNADEANNQVNIGFKTDIDAVVDNLKGLVKGFNRMVNLAAERSDGTFENSKLSRDLRGIANVFGQDLKEYGLKIDDEGHMDIDEALVHKADKAGTLPEGLKRYGQLKTAMYNKANNVAINPMNYVNKKLIAYKNPNSAFNSPYVSSIYSGMIFSGAV